MSLDSAKQINGKAPENTNFHKFSPWTPYEIFFPAASRHYAINSISRKADMPFTSQGEYEEGTDDKGRTALHLF